MNSIVKPSPRFDWSVFAWIGVHLAIALTLSHQLNIWRDEAYTLTTTSQNLSYALNQALNLELQPPLYFLLLTLWRGLNQSIFFARLFSVLCTTLTLYVVAVIWRRVCQTIHPAWVVGLIAINPFFVWAATEARCYALVILFSALLLLFFLDGYVIETPQKFTHLLYILIAILALYTQYYSAFLLASNGIVLCWQRNWQRVWQYGVGMAITTLFFAPMVPIGLAQKAAHVDSQIASPSLWVAVKVIMRRLMFYVLPSDWITGLARQSIEPLFYIVAGVVLGMIGVKLISHWHRIQAPAQAILLTVTILCCIFIPVVMVTHEDLVLRRHTSILFIPLMLAVVVVLNAAILPLFQVADHKRMLLGWLCITLLFSITSMLIGSEPLAKAKVGDWQRVANYITMFEHSNQPVLVFIAESELALKHYYHGQNILIPLPQPVRILEAKTPQVYDLRSFALKDEQEIFTALAKVDPHPQSLWLVQSGPCEYAGVDYNCAGLENFVARNYTVVREQQFLGTSVRLLQRQPT